MEGQQALAGKNSAVSTAKQGTSAGPDFGTLSDNAQAAAAALGYHKQSAADKAQEENDRDQLDLWERGATEVACWATSRGLHGATTTGTHNPADQPRPPKEPAQPPATTRGLHGATTTGTHDCWPADQPRPPKGCAVVARLFMPPATTTGTPADQPHPPKGPAQPPSWANVLGDNRSIGRAPAQPATTTGTPADQPHTAKAPAQPPSWANVLGDGRLLRAPAQRAPAGVPRAVGKDTWAEPKLQGSNGSFTNANGSLAKVPTAKKAPPQFPGKEVPLVKRPPPGSTPCPWPRASQPAGSGATADEAALPEHPGSDLMPDGTAFVPSEASSAAETSLFELAALELLANDQASEAAHVGQRAASAPPFRVPKAPPSDSVPRPRLATNSLEEAVAISNMKFERIWTKLDKVEQKVDRLLTILDHDRRIANSALSSAAGQDLYDIWPPSIVDSSGVYRPPAKVSHVF